MHCRTLLACHLVLATNINFHPSSILPQDKNPAPLQQLDALLDETYHSLLDLADETEAGNEATARAGADLVRL